MSEVAKETLKSLVDFVVSGVRSNVIDEIEERCREVGGYEVRFIAILLVEWLKSRVRVERSLSMATKPWSDALIHVVENTSSIAEILEINRGDQKIDFRPSISKTDIQEWQSYADKRHNPTPFRH